MPDARRGGASDVTGYSWVLLALVVLALVVVALTLPVPSPVELRDRAQSLGPWAPLAFLLVHAVVTAAPFPRTTFTLGAGLLFGPWIGVPLCLLASTVSAALGFALSRRLGGRAVERLGPGRVRALERRLSRRGLFAVLSTRLLPAIPFAPLNYTFGVTTVRWRPYLVGTAIGLIPGTTAVVVAGDAVTGTLSPTSLIVFVVSGSLGLAGVLWSARRGDEDDPDAEGPVRD